jgi:hypothetical protein
VHAQGVDAAPAPAHGRMSAQDVRKAMQVCRRVMSGRPSATR